MSFHELVAEQGNYCCIMEQQGDFCPAHFHSALEFVFVTEGSVVVTLDGETRVLAKGEGYFADSFHLHGYHGDERTKLYLFIGDKRYFEPFFQEKKGLSFPAFFAFSEWKVIEQLRDIYQSVKSEEEKLGLFGGLAQIFAVKLAHSVGLCKRERKKSSNLVSEILLYAHERPSEDLSLDALSKEFGYSREHLSTVIHSHLREHWNTYVSRMRVTRAHDILLDKPNATVLEIALSCGFENATTFYRAYKKQFGAPPRRK